MATKRNRSLAAWGAAAALLLAARGEAQEYRDQLGILPARMRKRL